VRNHILGASPSGGPMRYIESQRREPTIGTERVIQKFLWFPKTINGETRWWETTLIKQRAEQRYVHYFAPGMKEGYYQKEVRWINKEWMD
jgi:hypothetical protein